jgi:hypothetical protein
MVGRNDESVTRSLFCLRAAVSVDSVSYLRITHLILKQVSPTDTNPPSYRTDTYPPTWKVPEAFLLLEARFLSTRPRTGFASKFPTFRYNCLTPREHFDSTTTHHFHKHIQTYMSNKHAAQYGRAQYPKCSAARARVDASHLPR